MRFAPIWTWGAGGAAVLACAVSASAQNRDIRTPPESEIKVPPGQLVAEEAHARNARRKAESEYAAKLREFRHLVVERMPVGKETGENPCSETLDRKLHESLYYQIRDAAAAYDQVALKASEATFDYYGAGGELDSLRDATKIDAKEYPGVRARLAAGSFAVERGNGSSGKCDALAGSLDLRVDYVFSVEKYAADSGTKDARAAATTTDISADLLKLDGARLAETSVPVQTDRYVTHRAGCDRAFGGKPRSAGAFGESYKGDGDGGNGGHHLTLDWSYESGAGKARAQHLAGGALKHEWRFEGAGGAAIASLLNAAAHSGDRPCADMLRELSKAAFAYLEAKREGATADGLLEALRGGIAKIRFKLDAIAGGAGGTGGGAGDHAGRNNGFGNGPDAEPPGHVGNEHAAHQGQDD